ncbi:MAG: VCBS repeat-containing protein [Candidatus Cloacimonas sp.]|nr:VCBS repeat-containing protein [Candidatus Cloacimonadota bacterium]
MVKRSLLFIFLVPVVLFSLTFSEVKDLSIPGVSNTSFHWGDLNNDGYLDLLITGSLGPSYLAKVFKNYGDYQFIELSGIVLDGVRDSSVEWGDFNNDGYLDFVISGLTENSRSITKLYKNNGDMTFTEVVNTPFVGVKSGTIKWVDYNSDGWLDLFVAGETETKDKVARLYKNIEGERFEWQTSLDLPGFISGDAAWGDFNNDGFKDVVITGNGDGGQRITKLYVNNGGTSFTSQDQVKLPELYYSSVSWGDYDNDGYVDLLITGSGRSSRVAQVYKNNQGNSLTLQSQIALSPVAYGRGIWADLNNDGKLDIIIIGEETFNNFYAKIYLNQGNGSFVGYTGSVLPGLKNSDIAAVDLNNSGKLDIIMAGIGRSNNQSTVEFKMFENKISKSNTPPTSPSNLNVNLTGSNASFSWDASRDNETPSAGLSYNIVILNQGYKEVELMYPMADLDTGQRRVSDVGNVGSRTSLANIQLKDGHYQWCVQAIDSVNAGSVFSGWSYFYIDSNMVSQPTGLRVEVQSEKIYLVWDKVAGALSYNIYSSAEPYDGEWVPLGSTTATVYEVPNDQRYQFFRITAESSSN